MWDNGFKNASGLGASVTYPRLELAKDGVRAGRN